MLRPVYSNTSANNLERSVDICRSIIAARLHAYFNNEPLDLHTLLKQQSDISDEDFLRSTIAENISNEEWLALMVALMPHIKPNFFESLIIEQMPNGGDFAEIGGVKGTNHRGMLPTGETLQFILAGTEADERLKVHHYFWEDHFFYKQGILWLETVKEGEPVMSGRLMLGQEWVDKILFNKEWSPRFGNDFPAKKITTAMIWSDAVLHHRTVQQIKDIRTWLQYHKQFSEDDNLKRKIKPGYRVLFYGASGTGKSLTAALLGKEFNKDVYRIDLSQIVSKYIGETEKNLETVFRKAETKDWILFFDEADALFGKRTNVQSAHDKYANQEVSYLLQRVEDYQGLMILASNFKNNLDEAFIRRFHSVVHFPIPNVQERCILWEKALPVNLRHHASVNVNELSEKFELTGASILNAVQFAALQSYARNDQTLFQNDLIEGVKKEFLKEEKSI